MSDDEANATPRRRRRLGPGGAGRLPGAAGGLGAAVGLPPRGAGDRPSPSASERVEATAIPEAELSDTIPARAPVQAPAPSPPPPAPPPPAPPPPAPPPPAARATRAERASHRALSDLPAGHLAIDQSLPFRGLGRRRRGPDRSQVGGDTSHADASADPAPSAPPSPATPLLPPAEPDPATARSDVEPPELEEVSQAIAADTLSFEPVSGELPSRSPHADAGAEGARAADLGPGDAEDDPAATREVSALPTADSHETTARAAALTAEAPAFVDDDDPARTARAQLVSGDTLLPGVDPDPPPRPSTAQRTAIDVHASQPAPLPGGLQRGMVVADRYRITGLVGEGGMAAVYAARDQRDGRPTALKLLRLAEPDSELARRFRREMRLCTLLVHPKLVETWDYGEWEGYLFIAMELLAGRNLDEELSRRSPQPLRPREAVRVAQEVAVGLAAAHERGVLHRDIKPANIFVCDAGRAIKVLDFGIAGIADSTTQLTAPNAAPGTPAYMAPERIRGGESTTSSDLWSLGVILFEMLAGRRPFDARPLNTLMGDIVLEPAPDLAALRPDLPRPLTMLVSELLDKDPARRPGHALQLARRLSAVSRVV